MQSLWAGIYPQAASTRILVMAGAETTLLKARLRTTPSSRTALPTLLEAIALWQGSPVRAALAVNSRRSSFETSLCRDSFPDFGSALYSLEYVDTHRPPRRSDPLTGMGRFDDLRQLLLFSAAR